MLVTGSSYVALISVPGLPQSSMTATSTSTFSIVGSTDGFPRESNGGWMVHTVGSDPTPEGCRNLVAATFHEGYSLKTYLSSNAVKAGGLVCVDIVLQHVNGTVVTWGRSDELITGFNVTNSSGQVLDSLT